MKSLKGNQQLRILRVVVLQATNLAKKDVFGLRLGSVMVAMLRCLLLTSCFCSEIYCTCLQGLTKISPNLYGFVIVFP